MSMWLNRRLSLPDHAELLRTGSIDEHLLLQSPEFSPLIPYAVAVLRGDSKIGGTVTFEQASEGAETTVSWNISGHDANAERGMHVHAFGDNTNGCTSAGPHCEYFLCSKHPVANSTNAATNQLIFSLPL